MGIFDRLKGKAPAAKAAPVAYPFALGAVADGKFVPMKEIPDDVFSQGVLGTCCGIDPTEGKVYAPADGKVSQLTDTLHAVGITIGDGDMEILIHVGIDTVDMNGAGFSNKVKLNQSVKKGDLLLTMDLDKIRGAGHPTVVITAVTNSDDFASVEETASGTVQMGDAVLQVTK